MRTIELAIKSCDSCKHKVDVKNDRGTTTGMACWHPDYLNVEIVDCRICKCYELRHDRKYAPHTQDCIEGVSDDSGEESLMEGVSKATLAHHRAFIARSEESLIARSEDIKKTTKCETCDHCVEIIKSMVDCENKGTCLV